MSRPRTAAAGAPAADLAGLIEVRGLGIRRLPYEPLAWSDSWSTSAARDAERLPSSQRNQAVLAGIALPRLAVAAGRRPACHWCWRICCNRPIRLICGTAAGDGILRETPYMQRCGMPLEATGWAVYCNAATHYNRSPSPCTRALDHDERPFVRRNRARREFSPMIGLVLVTHGRLAVEFRAALEHVVGPQSRSRPSPSAPTTTSSSAATTSSRRSSASTPATASSS